MRSRFGGTDGGEGGSMGLSPFRGLSGNCVLGGLSCVIDRIRLVSFCLGDCQSSSTSKVFESLEFSVLVKEWTGENENQGLPNFASAPSHTRHKIVQASPLINLHLHISPLSRSKSKVQPLVPLVLGGGQVVQSLLPCHRVPDLVPAVILVHIVSLGGHKDHHVVCQDA